MVLQSQSCQYYEGYGATYGSSLLSMDNGAYAYDTDCCNTIPFVNEVNGGPSWTYRDTDAIETISLSDFDVVTAP